VLVDDHPAILDAIAAAVDETPDLAIAGTARTLDEARALLPGASAVAPDVIVSDVQLAGEAEGLRLLEETRERTGMPIVTEVTSPELVEVVAEAADMLQIGARNTQNFALLAEVGRSERPVLFKRGMSTSVAEYLQAAEYILSQGNPNVVLCERGIRTFETATRFTLDVSAVPVLKELTHLPVWVDPSHAAGRRSLVPSLALAAAAAGADGLIIEVHPSPEEARSDAAQQLDDAEFGALMGRLRGVVAALGKSL